MQIHLKTLGCRLNEAELETWAAAYQRAGHQLTRQVEDAQLVVINSCAVTEDAARKSKQLIRRVHRSNPQAKLVVSGCYASLNSDEAAQLMGVDLVVSNADKAQLVNKTLTELNLNTMPAMSTEPGEVSLFSRGRQRAFVKVQDGCRYRCTFCIVTVARGDEVSRPVAEVVEEINTLQQQGIKEVILTGVHLGGYGGDINSSITDLIKAILANTTVERLRLGSLEPWELPADFFQLFSNPRLLPHLHLPLQSGSDSVLKRMARRCKSQEFAALVQQAKQVPDFNITTDIIVGFPGETEAEWQQSLDFIAQTGFGHMHIFSYSPRAGTAAASFPGQLNSVIKKQRSQALHGLAAQLKHAFIVDNLGKEMSVLWEGQTESLENGKQRWFGYTQNYLRVACEVEAERNLANEIMPVRLLCDEGQFIKVELIK